MATTTSDGSFMLFGLNLNALGATWEFIGVVCSIEVLMARSLLRCIGYINFTGVIDRLYLLSGLLRLMPQGVLTDSSVFYLNSLQP